MSERHGTHGVMGMLDRAREPRADGVPPSLRGVAEPLWAADGVSRTSRRNC